MAKRRKQYQTAQIFDFIPSTSSPTNLINIKPRNDKQKRYLNYLANPVINIVCATGPAGTGKTLLAVTQGVKDFRARFYEKIVITRPAVSVDEQHGFLPGTLNEKMEPWMRPITDIILDYMSQQQLDYFIKKQKIEIVPLAYMRGRTFLNSCVIVDECQNLDHDQTLMILQRIGLHSKMMFCGDTDQVDLKKNGESGLGFLRGVTEVKGLHTIELLTNHRHPILEDILNYYKKYKFNEKI